MQNYFKTNNGLQLLCDWSGGRYSETEYTKNESTALKAARRVYNSLIIEAGEKPRSAAEFAGGLGYTSSSSFAALWLVNNQAKKRGTEGTYFDGIALTIDGAPVAVYTIYKNGNEAGEVYEIIKF